MSMSLFSCVLAGAPPPPPPPPGPVAAACCARATALASYPSCAPVDAPAAAAAWAPWTHPPHCAAPAGPCLYTHARACGPGLSIVAASPAAAHDILRRLPAACGGTPGAAPAYEVRPVAGKGMGVFATRAIPRGTRVLADAPAVLRREGAAADADADGGAQLLDRAVAQLRQPASVLQLAQHEGFAGSRAENAAAHNSFTVRIGAEEYAGIFPRVSRHNHACNPNCGVQWLPDELALSIWTWRDIAPGEELTITYIALSPELTHSARQAQLARTWRFRCACALCGAPAAQRRASDARRARFRALQAQYWRLDCARPEQARRALRLLDAQLAIHRRERLMTSEAPLLLQGAWTALRGGLAPAAVRWTRRLEDEMRARGFANQEDEDHLRAFKQRLGLV